MDGYIYKYIYIYSTDIYYIYICNMYISICIYLSIYLSIDMYDISVENVINVKF